MKVHHGSKFIRTTGIRAAACLGVATALCLPQGCGASGFLGLQDYQRELLFGLAAALLTNHQSSADADGGTGQPLPGADGLNCWDINGNGQPDHAEDTNGDGIFNARDCRGSVGVEGVQGPPGDDGASGATGPKGSTGPTGPQGTVGSQGTEGPQGPEGPAGTAGSNGANGQAGPPGAPGPEFFDVLVDDFFGNAAAGPGQLPVLLVPIIEPFLGLTEGETAAIAFRAAIPRAYADGNDVTLRLFFHRTGSSDGGCFVFSLDARRLRPGWAGPRCYGGSEVDGCAAGRRWITITSPNAAGGSTAALVGPLNTGQTVVVDLPINTVAGLSLPNDLTASDLLAIELRAVRSDGGKYQILAAEFFETARGEAVLRGGAVFTSENDVNCSQCNKDADCDDARFCNGAETCDQYGGCAPGIPPCANEGLCDEDTDECRECTADADCNNDLFCDGVEICVTGRCQAGTSVRCDDGIACTRDSCNEADRTCDYVPDSTACDDGVFCNGVEACSPAVGCQPGGIPCPQSSCDEETRSCAECATNDDCDNGVFCDGTETCIAGHCQAGTPVNCDDGISCTQDSCDNGETTCHHTPDAAACDDGAFCNGVEVCNPTVGCLRGDVPCTEGLCVEVTRSCVDCLTDADCDNSIFCDGTETCAGGYCHTGVAVNCDDGTACTMDYCNEGTAMCDHTPDAAVCDDGVFCNGAEICDATAGCRPGDDPCPKSLCDEATASCVGCLTDADCDNGVFCDGAERCAQTVCVPGTPPCDDDDTCDEEGDDCRSCRGEAETITFEEITPGTRVTQVFGDGGSGPIGVFGHNPCSDKNAAVAFDSSHPTGGDTDLGAPNKSFGGPGVGTGGLQGKPYQNAQPLGNLLIVDEDLKGEPDDAAKGHTYLRLDFAALPDGTATIVSLTVIDIEDCQRKHAAVEFFDPAGHLLGKHPLPATGDNGVGVVDFGGVPVSGVRIVKVSLNGSGAIDTVVFKPCE